MADGDREPTTPLADRHDGLGAVWGTPEGVRLPRHYGDPAGEYAAAREKAVVIDRTGRTVVRVWGREPVKMVQGLLTNDLASAPADRAVYGALLTPKGRMVADVRVLRHGDALLLDAAPGAREPMLAHLKRYMPPLFARHEDVSAEWGVLGVYGPAADEVLAAMDAAAPAQEEDAVAVATLSGHEALLVRTAYAGVPGVDLLVPADALDAVWSGAVDAGARPAGHGALEVLRIEAGSPRWGAELDEDRIPLEAGLKDRAISTTKGCYTGQEVIIRILHRGHVNWNLRGLLLGDAPVPPPGTELTRPGEEKVVGRVTSACLSPQLGETVALGYVRREIEPGSVLELAGGGTTARVAGLPLAPPAAEQPA